MGEQQEFRVLDACRGLLRNALQHAQSAAHEDSVLAIRAAIARVEADMRAALRSSSGDGE